MCGCQKLALPLKNILNNISHKSMPVLDMKTRTVSSNDSSLSLFDSTTEKEVVFTYTESFWRIFTKETNLFVHI